jgi:drug/metabolite transporter (DMT)-like permease
VLWGGTFVVLRESLASIGPAALVSLRFALATPIVLALAARKGARWDRPAIAGGLAGGACATLGFLAQAIGLRDTSPGTSAFLTATGSLFAGVLAWPLLGQRPGARLAAGIAIATAGVALLTGVRGVALGPGERWTLLGALGFGLQVVALARFAPRTQPLALAAVQAATIAALAAPFAVRELGAVSLSAALAPRLAYLVLAGSVVAPLCQVAAQRSLGAGSTGLMLGLEPIVATGLSMAARMEQPGVSWWIGGALILSAVLSVEARGPRRAPDTPDPSSGRTAA